MAMSMLRLGWRGLAYGISRTASTSSSLQQASPNYTAPHLSVRARRGLKLPDIDGGTRKWDANQYKEGSNPNVSKLMSIVANDHSGYY